MESPLTRPPVCATLRRRYQHLVDVSRYELDVLYR
jgi:hypothetical protein